MADERIPAMAWFRDRKAYYGAKPPTSQVRRTYDVFERLIILVSDEHHLLTSEQMDIVENTVLHGLRSDADIFSVAAWIKTCPRS